MKSPREARKALVAALRSGRYTQITGGLERLDADGNVIGNCCLGVACREYIADGGTLELRRMKLAGDEYTAFAGDGGFLPGAVQAWLGFANALGNNSRQNLAYLNDHGTTFAEIADIIEREPEGLVSE